MNIATLSLKSKIGKNISDAFQKAEKEQTIIKLPNQLLSTALIPTKCGKQGILVDIITNFRTIDGVPLGHLDTNVGKIPIPQYWPVTPEINAKYGHPRRDGLDDLLVDMYVISDDYKNPPVIDLPMYTEWSK